MSPKIPRYNRLEPYYELGPCAELELDSELYDVSNLSVNELMTIYEPHILNSQIAILESESVGAWKYNHDRRKWEKER